jgi:flagellin-like protein
MYKNRKAVSPVIATVILVAVAITISVAVAYWMGGISSQYTKFEKVEVQNAVVTQNPTGTWTVIVNLKNTGTSQCTITDMYVNDRPLTAETSAYTSTMTAEATPGAGKWGYKTSTTIASGASAEFTVSVMNGGSGVFSALTAGTTVNLKFHSAGGMDYLKLCELV